MKLEYVHLKLIIETPTEKALENVNTTFGLKWGGFSPWDVCGGDLAICLDNGNHRYSKIQFYRQEPHFNRGEYARLTYPEFVARFLVPKAVTLEQAVADILELRSLINVWVEMREALMLDELDKAEKEFTEGLKEALTKTQHYANS